DALAERVKVLEAEHVALKVRLAGAENAPLKARVTESGASQPPAPAPPPQPAQPAPNAESSGSSSWWGSVSKGQQPVWSGPYADLHEAIQAGRCVRCQAPVTAEQWAGAWPGSPTYPVVLCPACWEQACAQAQPIAGYQQFLQLKLHGASHLLTRHLA